MKQILQDLKNGRTEVADLPAPLVRPGHLLIRSVVSLISAGTERMLVGFGKSSLLEKARQQPDKVRMVLDKIQTDGLSATIESVRNKLDQMIPMGYSNVGVIEEVGDGVSGFRVGQTVVSNGSHAEYVCVPQNLCAVVPDNVDAAAASFTVVGAIALQGIRLIQPSLGETIVVIGLGLVGLLSAQLLCADGCHVVGIDTAAPRVALANDLGIEAIHATADSDPVAAALAHSQGRGVDGVLIAASTKSSAPIHQAARMCRQRGRIVLVGVTGTQFTRADFYDKELSFQVSCSYGPGRYDSEYELNGHDYPFGLVRWTEKRNFEAVLYMLSSGRIDIKPLITHRFALDEAPAAYELLSAGGSSLGILIEYGGQDDASRRTEAIVHAQPSSAKPKAATQRLSVGFIGAGNYATGVLIPAFKNADCELSTVVSQGGISSLHAARKFGFARASTMAQDVFSDPSIDAVAVASRHDSHAQLVADALAAGKHVYVEKPIATSDSDLDYIEQSYQSMPDRPVLMVGFNRRFSPFILKMKDLLRMNSHPAAYVVTVNAGSIPADHWTQDPAIGGGRIVGEACHFIDLLRYLAASPIVRSSIVAMKSTTGDTATVQLEFGDGSIGTVHYFANGHKSLPKERVEVFTAGRVLQLDNYRSLRGYGWKSFRRFKMRRQDKGHSACARAFAEAAREGRPSPIPFGEIIEVARTTLELSRRTESFR